MIAAAEPSLTGERPLDRTLLPLLTRSIAATRERLSEYSASNLYLYRARHKYRFRTDPVPHIVGTAYDGTSHALPLAPIGAAEADVLLAGSDWIGPVGEKTAAALAGRLGLILDWNEDDSDYVYAAERLAALQGARVKRSQARAFNAAMRPAFVPIDPTRTDAAHAVLAGWFGDVGRSAAETDLAECREALDLMAPLGLEGWLVDTPNAGPVAFLLAGPGADGGRVVHFAKGRRAHAGAYPWMFSRFAAQVGRGWINFEQDLGKPGFAQAKRAFAPAARLRKYRLRRDG